MQSTCRLIWNFLGTQQAAVIVQVGVALVLLITLIVLFCNLLKLGEQNSLLQTFNKPLCGVKITVDPVRDNVKQITLSVKNFGKYVANSVSIRWKINDAKLIKDANPPTMEITKLLAENEKGSLAVLPEQEAIVLFYQVNKKDFNEKVNGATGSGIAVAAAVEYKVDEVTHRYSCTYLITRLADVEKDVYEIALVKSEFMQL